MTVVTPTWTAHTFHPAYIFRGQRRFEGLVIQAFNKLRRCETGWRPKWDRTGYITRPNLSTVLKVLREMAKSGRRVSYDIETDGKHPLVCTIRCIAFWDGKRGICVPFVFRAGDKEEVIVEGKKKSVLRARWTPYFGEAELAQAKQAIQSVFDSCPLDTQNGQYDRLCLEARMDFAVPSPADDPKKYHDSILAHHIVASYFPHNLGFLASVYTEAPYYKTTDDGDAWSSESDAELWQYNCLHGEQRVVMASGRTMTIADIVKRKATEPVLGTDPQGRIVATPVLNHHRQRVEGQRWIEVKHRLGRGVLRVTPDHYVYTQRGRIRAAHLEGTDSLVLPERRLSVEQEATILGTCLGDSTLAVSPDLRGMRESPTAALTGSNVHEGLVKWKAAVLPGLTYYRVSRGKYRDAFQYRTKNMVQLGQLRSELYEAEGTRRVKGSVLARLGPAGWAMWFADDGCYQKPVQRANRPSQTSDTVCLAVHRYSLEDRERVRAWLEREFRGHVGCYSGVLRLSRAAAENFCHYIAKKVPLEVRYKLLPEYRDFPEEPVEVCEEGLLSSIYCIGPDTIDRTNRTVRARAETRWCITTGTGNFFTLNGLVKNCDDVQVQYTVCTKTREEITERAEDKYLFQHDAWQERECQRWRHVGAVVDENAIRLLRKEYGTIRDKSLAAMRAELAKQSGNERSAELDELLDKLVGDSDETEQQDDGRTEDKFNPASLAQLRLLLKHLGIPLTAETATGQLSTAKEFLLEARRELLLNGAKPGSPAVGFLDFLFSWREASKLESTYLHPELIPEESGLVWKLNEPLRPQLAGLVGIHATFNAHIVPTGRLSSSGPNFQNQPEDIRGIFIARPGHVLVTGDWDALEMRLAAILSGDQKLLKVFEEYDAGTGLKPHIVNAAAIFGLPLNEELQKKYPGCYRAAKCFAYAVAYGAGPTTVFDQVRKEMPDLEFREFMRLYTKYKSIYPRLFEFQRDVVMRGTQHQYLDSGVLQRRVYFLERVMGEDSPEASKMQNMPYQSTGADVVSLANRRIMKRVVLPWRETLHPGEHLEQLAQVHDELLFEVPVRLAEEFAARYKSIAEETPFAGEARGRPFVTWKLPVAVNILRPLAPGAPSRWKPLHASSACCETPSTVEIDRGKFRGKCGKCKKQFTVDIQ